MPGFNDFFDTRYWKQTGPNDFTPVNGQAYNDWLTKGVDTSGYELARPVSAPSNGYMGPMGGAPNADRMDQKTLDFLFDNFIKARPPQVDYATGDTGPNMRADRSQGFDNNSWYDAAHQMLYFALPGQGWASIPARVGENGNDLQGRPFKTYDYNGNLIKSETWDHRTPKWLSDSATQAIGTLAMGGMLGAAAFGGLGAAGGAGAGGAGGAGAGAGALDLGGGLSMAADGSIIGGTGAFVPATAAEMGAMTGGGALGAAGGALDLGGGLTMGADGAIAGGTGAFVPPTAAEMGAMTGAGAAGAGGALDLGGGLTMAPDGSIAGGTGAFTPPTAGEMGAMTGAAGLGTTAMGAGAAADGVMPPNPFATGDGVTPGNPFASGAGGLSPGDFDWTKLIGPGLAALGGIAGADAAGKAADAQLQSVRESNALLKDIFDKQVALQEPFRQGGINGLLRLQELLGVGGNAGAPDYGSAARDFSTADFKVDPGYGFRQSEQQKALERAASTRGGLNSGKFYKDAMTYSGDLASQEYGNAYNRYNLNRTAKLNPLQSLAGVGQTSANTLTSAAANFGNQAADNITSGGNASASGIMGRTNSLVNGIGKGYSMYDSGQQADQNTALINALLRR